MRFVRITRRTPDANVRNDWPDDRKDLGTATDTLTEVRHLTAPWRSRLRLLLCVQALILTGDRRERFWRNHVSARTKSWK
jgi:hypothetical protein